MALIKCVECGKEISDRAKVCPHCGCPIEFSTNNFNSVVGVLDETNNTKSLTQKKKKLCIGLFVVFGIVVIIALVLLFNNAFTDTPPDKNAVNITTTNTQYYFNEGSNNNKNSANNQNNNAYDNYEYEDKNENGNVTQNNSEIPTEAEYTKFICDYYNQELSKRGVYASTHGYYRYDLEKHAYQWVIGTNFIEPYRYLSQGSVYESYRFFDEVFRSFYNKEVEQSIKWQNELEYNYGYDVTIEVLAPETEEVLFVVTAGEPIYSAYFNYTYQEVD